ncbi:glycosyltransferase family 2 protein [Bacillus sp. J37]|uniref:glycosyltransferase family 2 protein n=1 Tax=Bacillus sp. J37 TaxID=935837 RepID=UPI00047997D2|nr:glycosyltransferase family 2 protein [Bacillus sp. J37]
MKTLTVFTPTYNRAYCLSKCYESLKRQSSKDFIWLIIDDGSTDNTAELVGKWILEESIEITYIKQENQGMHGAHNTAYENINTELNVCIDSDDYMPDDAIEKILNFWGRYGSAKVSGLIGLDSDKNGQIIGTKLPKELKESTLFDLYNKYAVKGDKKIVYRTELIKKYPYPLFKGENYVGLAYKYYKLDQEYPLLLMNEILCIVEYLPDGSSMNMYKQYKKNPNGFAFYRKELMKLPYTSTSFKFKQAIHYVSSSILANNKNFIREAPSKLLILLAYPLGLILYVLVILKTKAT